MAITAQYDFNGADGSDVTLDTPTVGAALATCSYSLGPLVTKSGRAHSNLSAGNYGFVESAGPAADYKVKAIIRRVAATSGAAGDIRLRASAADKFIGFYFSDTQIAQYENNNGSLTFINYLSNTFTVGQDYTIELWVNGSTARWFVDGTEVFSPATCAITGTQKAVLVLGNATQASTATNGFHCDKFWVETFGGLEGAVSATPALSSALTGAPTVPKQFATRCIPDGDQTPLSGYASSHTGGVSTTSFHFARAAVSALRLLCWNGRTTWNGVTYGSESGNGASMTIETAIEYPVGTFTRIKWGGSNSGTIANNALAYSDYATVSIPKGAKFFIHMYRVCAGGVGYNPLGNATSGDRYSHNGSSLVMSGGVPNDFPGRTSSPLAILARTTARSVIFFGTSRTTGYYDTRDATGDIGGIIRSIGHKYGYINTGMSADRLSAFMANVNTARMAVANHVTDVIIDHGINDDQGTIQANELSFAGMFPGRFVHGCTQAPVTTGAWTLADGSDQTVSRDLSAHRAWLLGHPAPFTRIFDVNAVVALLGNEKKWHAGYTDDGVHENATAFAAIYAAGIVRIEDTGPRLWARLVGPPDTRARLSALSLLQQRLVGPPDTRARLSHLPNP